MMHKPTLLCSTSGGLTSMYMAALCAQHLRPYFNIVNIFANTGQENEQTLDFVRRGSEFFGLNVVWVEAEISPQHGVGTRSRVVTFETATRDGSLFEKMAAKYGIPNQSYPHCTRELKTRPIHAYMKTQGFNKKEYLTAIGIRTDERHRERENDEFTLVYPLLSMFPSDKIDVGAYWEDVPFTLGLKDHEGNCKWCWKKSNRKHYRIIQDNPRAYDVPAHLEKEYGRSGAEHRKNPSSPPRRLFRGNRSTSDMIALADITDAATVRFYDDIEDATCSQSCEFV